MLNSAALNLENKVICRYSGLTFQTFILQNQSIILSPFLKGFSFHSKDASHTPNFIDIISCRRTLPHDFQPFLIEPRREKTGFLHMRKQRRRSASR